ncbi:MAG: choice-of-anchor A family protein [Melioribacteraceae bacterium]|nr:choice-of-anchor A family protein [Melioribacteraceae bacterium]
MKKIFLLIPLFFLFISLSAQNSAYPTLGSWDYWGFPSYAEATRDEISDDFLSRIRASVSEGVRTPNEHPEWFTDDVVSNITLTQEADVFVSYVTEGAGYRNVLGYYTYDSSNPPTSVADIEDSRKVIFPNVSNYGSGGSLQPGDKVKIGRFAAGTTIGWFVAANGFRPPAVTPGYWQVYSNTQLNSPSDPAKKQHVVLLNDELTNRFVIAFEDIQRDRGGDEDFNDAIFYASSNPPSSFNKDKVVKIIDPNRPTYTDLSIDKVIDNPSPSDKDEIQFTITLKNNGQIEAENVQVRDHLPEGLSFISADASVGSYNLEDGIWSIAVINSGEEHTLVIKALVDLEQISQSAFDLGPAQDFNLFIFQDLNQPSADTEGRIAVGRDALLAQYSVGDKLSNPDSTVDVLIAQRDLIFLSGSVFNGNAVYGRNTNLPENEVSVVNGSLRKERNVINWGKAKSHLKSLSRSLSKYDVTGDVIKQNSGLILTGSEPFLNVFSVPAEDLSEAVSFTMSVPNGSVALINVIGKDVDWSGDLTINGTAINNVLFNFPRTKRLKIQSISVNGSILAPFAALEYPTGQINGQVIANSMDGSGQFNSGENQKHYFIGNVPVSENLVNEAEITEADQFDPDEENNISSVSLQLSGYADPENVRGINWEVTSKLSQNELIWVMDDDQNGNLLAGTWGGKIFRSTNNGTDWTQIISSMSVGFVWDLAVDGSEIIAATDRGLYISNDDGANWELLALETYDIRAVLKVGDNIFAGTWGGGVFKSTDDGSSWNPSNNGLVSNVIHALTVDSQGNIYSGSFGGGVAKSEDDGDSWNEVSFGNNYVWTLEIDSQDRLWAGTYGAGIWRSSDLNDSWVNVNNNLPATHIYSIRIDESDDLFVSSWTMGVFYLPNDNKKAEIWGNLGLGGLGISSLYFDNKTGTLLAGSNDGYLYKNSSPLTDIEDAINSLPEVFKLDQNYPNPFNPTTTISFSIPESGEVQLVIYNYLGEEIRTLVNQTMSSGANSVVWNGKDNEGNAIASGMYIYSIRVNGKMESKKMMLLK